MHVLNNASEQVATYSLRNCLYVLLLSQVAARKIEAIVCCFLCSFRSPANSVKIVDIGKEQRTRQLVTFIGTAGCHTT
jgi:hypothetical protein